ncbi:hypothetical protein HY990_06090 [Candidatus Micrarchaeota archaeon]|nr:hypothetical protein [Candidatus Micrarchaeota archaeon]
MEKKYGILFLLLLGLPLAFAVPQGVGVLRNGHLDSVMADVKCKTDFNVGVISDFIAAVPNSSINLSSTIDKLAQDTAQLQSYANSNDTENFRSYLRSTYEPDARAAKAQLNLVRRGSNLDNSTRVSLRAQYDQLRSTYDSCHVAAVRSFVNTKADAYGKYLDDLDRKINDLGQKGVNVDSLRDLVSKARSVVIGPLRNDLGSADTAKLIRAAGKSYCMFDGCGNGTDFHLAAKFEIEKLDLILSKIESSNASNVSSEKIQIARGYLSRASAALIAVDDGKYTDESKANVWNNIKSASDEIQQIVHDTREKMQNTMRERAQEMRDQLKNRTNGRMNGSSRGGMMNQIRGERQNDD